MRTSLLMRSTDYYHEHDERSIRWASHDERSIMMNGGLPLIRWASDEEDDEMRQEWSGGCPFRGAAIDLVDLYFVEVDCCVYPRADGVLYVV